MATCEDYLAQIKSSYDDASWIWSTFQEGEKDWFDDNKTTHINFDNEWRQHIASAFINITAILADLIYCNTLKYQPERLPYYLEFCVGGDEYELTMEKIMDAVWESNKLESFFFINYIDAMRASIWNVEIQETKLAELYRHFSE